MSFSFAESKKETLMVIWVLLAVCQLSCQSKKVVFLSNDSIALGLPQVVVDSLLFKDSATVKMVLGANESVIRYTTDGSNVTESAAVYGSPLQIRESTQLRIKAFHPDYRPSDEMEVHLRKTQHGIATSEIMVSPNPHENYQGKGVATLVDRKKGSFNFRNGHSWLGFQDGGVTISLQFSEPKTLESVVLSMLNDQGSWIFLPKAISVRSKGVGIGHLVLDGSAKKGKKNMEFLEVALPRDSYKALDIYVMAIDEIPDWHPGKGTPPWTFIDEILIE